MGSDQGRRGIGKNTNREIMTYKQIKKLADELGLEVDNDLRYDYLDGWTTEIMAPEGKSFQCQYHAAVVCLRDENNGGVKLTKAQAWEAVADSMRGESQNLTDCDCGYWTEEEGII